MQFIDTRTGEKISALSAIVKGTPGSGGFFAPERIPHLTEKDFNILQELSFNERFAYIAHLFFDELDSQEILQGVEKVYSEEGYSLLEVDDGLHFLELFGRTCSYDDICFPFLRVLYDLSYKKLGIKGKSVILSTKPEQISSLGKCFKEVDYAIVVAPYSAYLSDEISDSACIFNESNVHTFRVNASNSDIVGLLSEIEWREKGVENVFYASHNWGNLLPLICSFISAYCDLLGAKKRKLKNFNLAIPEGDYRCLISALVAKEMGIPFYSVISGNNVNGALTNFLSNGIYSVNPFKKSNSAVLDEQYPLLGLLLFELCGRDASRTRELYDNYSRTNGFELKDPFYKRGLFAGDCLDEDVNACISVIMDEYDYLSDPSLALAYSVYNDYYAESGDEREVVILSLYSPFRFPCEVSYAVIQKRVKGPIKGLSELSFWTGELVPDFLEEITSKSAEIPVVNLDKLKEKLLLIIKDA